MTERFVKAADGLQLFFRDYAPLSPASGLPVILLHGLTRNSRDFELVAPRIASLGRRVIVPDVRGRGRSGRDPDPDHYAPPVYVQDLLGMLSGLGVDKAIYVGISMGGIVTMLLAAMAKDRVAGAVLVDIGPVIEEAGLKRIAGYVGRDMDFANWDEALAAVKTAQSSAFPKADDEFWRRFARRVCREENERVVYDYDPTIARPGASTTPPDMTPLFEALGAAPVLVVRGALSDLLSDEGVELMRIVRPELSAVDVPDVGHAPTLEEPEAWDAVLSFLAKAP
jgi:pimeloyl-ACP methyl ester carboxylesterase